MIVYLDSSIVISLVQRRPVLGPLAAARVAALLADGHQLAVSDLTRLECDVGPLRSNDVALLAQYETYFNNPRLILVSLTPAVCHQAAIIRAQHGFKTPDALHLAASLESGCELLLSHDRLWERFSDIPVEVLL